MKGSKRQKVNGQIFEKAASLGAYQAHKNVNFGNGNIPDFAKVEGMDAMIMCHDNNCR